MRSRKLLAISSSDYTCNMMAKFFFLVISKGSQIFVHLYIKIMLFSFTLHKNNLPILVHESRGLFICTGSYLNHQLTIWRHLVILLLCDCNDAQVFSCTMHLFIFLFGILFQRENDWPFFSIWRFHFSKTIFFCIPKLKADSKAPR